MAETNDKTPVGQNVNVMCKKCELEVAHVVLSHNEAGIIEKVKCQTCGDEHEYLPAKTKTPKKTAKKTAKGRRTKKKDPARDFEALTEKFQGKDAVDYSMSGSFKVDDVIYHKTFGIGYVISASAVKMEVVFSDKSRLLVCNR